MTSDPDAMPELTLSDAAAVMGCSVRQVRYLIKQGKLPAVKRGGMWWLHRDKLPRTEGQLSAQVQKAEELKQSVHASLGPHLQGPAKSKFGVSTLRAFVVGQEILLACRALPVPVPEATESFTKSLVSIGQGCHRFHPRDKSHAYKLAREEGARTVVLLHLANESATKALAARIEEDFLPAVSGLIRRTDRETGAP